MGYYQGEKPCVRGGSSITYDSGGCEKFAPGDIICTPGGLAKVTQVNRSHLTIKRLWFIHRWWVLLKEWWRNG